VFTACAPSTGYFGDLDARAGRLRPVEHRAVRLEALRAGEPQLEAKHLGRLDPAVRHVVPVAHPRDPLALPAAQRLAHREQVRQDLTRVRQVGEPVDHGDRRMTGELQHFVVVEGADHDTVDVARQHAGGVRDRLTPAQLDVAGREKQRLAAQLVGTHLERHPRASARLGEDHGERLPRERRLAVRPLLHALRQVEKALNLVPGEVGDREKVPFGHGWV